MESENVPQPSRSRVWMRRVIIGVACLPLVAASILHTMGRSGEFGVLGRWYVMGGLTLVVILGWELIEKAVMRTTVSLSTAEDGQDRAAKG